MRTALCRAALAAAALGIVAASAIVAAPAEARVVFGLGVGLPLYAPVYPPPVYYGPPPVYYAPPPVYYAPPPAVAPAPLQQNSAAQNWYYCDASRAYYPHVTSCESGWREVAPTSQR